MAITSSSTFAEVQAEYEDTAGYLINESVSEALRHAKAIAVLLVRLPMQATRGGNMVTYDIPRLEKQRADAISYAEAKGASSNGSSVIRADFSQLRAFG